MIGIERARFALRVPYEAKKFIAEQARLNGGSQNSEIVRCIRERMGQQTKAKPRLGFPERTE
jgi:hypothetical protein